ncbi:hypothetical protein [Eubacterium oxidoreducens]|uniref:Uncharacterized protein n=1 Tax=Eubacterium oxidoreducens TaxID=1732 RepID=A0A1G6C166_EUBOX|nr:hypothetical protein [Eubacterium oxidoreducens]SDB26611.1 hypothetical protein SAMN02910417_01964 [Eubacterium oxidoreducens]
MKKFTRGICVIAAIAVLGYLAYKLFEHFSDGTCFIDYDGEENQTKESVGKKVKGTISKVKESLTK